MHSPTTEKPGFHSGLLLAAALSVVISANCTFISDLINPPEPPATTIPPTQKISLGDVVPQTTQTIGITGGTITVSRPGSPLNGMTISVPDSAYEIQKSFSISYQPIQNHSLGTDFNPVSPMILISDGGGYAANLITLKIPCRIPQGHFAMGFFFNERSGELEGIPVVNQDGTSITIVTRHLSNTVVERANGLSKQATSVTAPDIIKIIISSIDGKLLEADTKTGFVIGLDDWEFPNYGTYITPGGSCAGQSLTAMWYFQLLKAGGGKLYEKYDSVHTKELWMDNPLGYKFTAVSQCDYRKQFNDPIKGQKVFLAYFNALAQKWDNIFRAFAYSIKLTGQPQYVSISNDKYSHAMIIYRVMNVGTNHILFTCDPNYPGQTSRAIMYDAATVSFKPYMAGVNASAPQEPYTRIYYCAKTAIVDYETLANRWDEVKTGAIGSAQFPPVKIQAADNAAFVELTDGYVSKSDTLTMSTACATCDASEEVYFKVYNRSGVKIDTVIDSKHFVVLSPGVSTLGVFSYALPLMDCAGEAIDPAIMGTDLYRWLDFKWVRVSYQSAQVSISPQITSGPPDKSYAFKAVVIPSQKTAKYVWNFGDGTADVTINADTNAIHTFTKSGTFIITCKVYDGTANKNLGEATASATIQAIVTPPGDPVITSITPDSAAPEATITIHGTGFGSVQAAGSVKISTTSYSDTLKISSWSDSAISGAIPFAAMKGNDITVGRKLPTDSYTKTSNRIYYNVYPDILITIRRSNKLQFMVVGNLTKVPSPDTGHRYIQISFGTMDRKKPVAWSAGSLQLTRRDYYDSTVGKEVYTDWDINMNAGGGGKTVSGTIKSHSVYHNVDSTAEDFAEVTFSGMKMVKFDHDFVTWSATSAEAKSCISFLKYYNWYTKYEGFDTLSSCSFVTYR